MAGLAVTLKNLRKSNVGRFQPSCQLEKIADRIILNLIIKDLPTKELLVGDEARNVLDPNTELVGLEKLRWRLCNEKSGLL